MGKAVPELREELSLIGQVINFRYEVLEKVGDGALFSVFKCRDKVLNRLVALKVLNQDLASDLQFVSALCDGCEEVSPLSHPNIARIYEADNSPEGCLVATEFAHGVDVAQRIRRGGPMSVQLALDIIIPVLEALEYAHANRFVHGDVRPQDIIVSPDGDVKLTDFGIARAMRQCPRVADRYLMRSLHYQAPEVIEGGAPSVAADVYSVGVVLYQMLTGVLPFDGATPAAVALKKVKEPPNSPRSLNIAVPKSLSDVVVRALASTPEERYPSALAMLADLRQIREALRKGTPTTIEQPVSVPVREVKTPYAEAALPDAEDSLGKRIIFLTALFVVVVLLFAGGTMLIKGRQDQIRVPPLLGKTWDEGVAIAREKGIQLIDDGRMYSDDYEDGQICSVIPPVGSIVKRSQPVVRVKISQGPSRIPVPDLVGLPESEANATAVREGFTIGKVTEEYSDKIPVNSVISQSPEAGLMRRPNTPISLVISLGPKPETVTPPTVPSLGASNIRRFSVSVEVPENVEGAQEVRIVVNDDRGETTVYQEQREPGDKFNVSISTVGAPARIRMYVGGNLVSDDTY